MSWQIAGVFAAVAAVLVAMWQLVSSSRSLIRERRADFYLEQLATIAVSLESGSTGADAEAAARIQFLPHELELPVVRVWAGTRFSPQGEGRLREKYEAAGSPGHVPGTATGFQTWLRETGRAEISDAVDQVLEMRLGRLRRAWQCWRSTSNA